ncbi:hypothetical protein AVEN_212122-1 [Araneus ventricosus]|uniref:Uncharacterized protein n=1 Tax=Araneus ventricosus TaxID=182803 RepID=A0A4Y2S7S3_ARAVE|nr:hypothetical protein AVEN_205095-1 [Araneus ventricosus]GBN84023.1 hypothetical protein AVEN_212122-1 [Araneus ventricosus]
MEDNPACPSYPEAEGGGHGGLVVRRVSGLKPISLDMYGACCTLDHTWGVKRSPFGVILKFGEGLPAQVSSWSSERGSKLRRTSQNSPRVASKRGVTTKRKTKTAKRPSVVFEAS